MQPDSDGRCAVLAEDAANDSEPSRIAAPGSGTRSMTASPIVLTCSPPTVVSSAATASENRPTSATASSSPCASVSAVKPAMSAKMKLAVDSATVEFRTLPSHMKHAAMHAVDAMDG